MTKFTPNFNWPVVEDTDVVKQYPTVVDEPFKTVLEAQLQDRGHIGSRFFGSYTASPPINVITPIPITSFYSDFADGGCANLVLDVAEISITGWYRISGVWTPRYAGDSDSYPRSFILVLGVGDRIQPVFAHYPEPRQTLGLWSNGAWASSAVSSESSAIMGIYGPPASVDIDLVIEYLGSNA